MSARGGRRVRWMVPALAVALAVGSGRAGAAGPEPRVSAGKSLAPPGELLARSRPGRDWETVARGEDVHSRDQLLALPGLQAEVDARSGAVRLTLRGGLPDVTMVPVLESEVVLHDSRTFDLDFTLQRGRVVLANRRSKGSARVWARLPTASWELTLTEPGAEAALEIYGRWPRGVPFTREPRPGEQPTQVVLLLVLKGQVELRAGGRQYLLSAPPGPASFHWDSVDGPAEGPRRRAELPAWARRANTPAPAARQYQNLLKGRDPQAALREMLTGDEKARTFAVYGLVALDDVPAVLGALADPKHADVRSAAVLALRHWIGASAGRDQQLFRVLIERLHYSPAEAETVLQLLHSPFDPDQPETYSTLIAYLRHDRLPVRELAWWHLVRLVPDGRNVPYDPAASEAQRENGWKQWKKRIPRGQLPPKEKKEQ